MKLIYLLLVVFSLMGQEQERETSDGLGAAIAHDLREGSFFIYDCKKNFFACVDKYSFDRCRDKRDKAFADSSLMLNCVPIKKMKNFNSCKKEHYRRMSTIVNKSFCLRKKKDMLKY